MRRRNQKTTASNQKVKASAMPAYGMMCLLYLDRAMPWGHSPAYTFSFVRVLLRWGEA